MSSIESSFNLDTSPEATDKKDSKEKKDSSKDSKTSKEKRWGSLVMQPEGKDKPKEKQSILDSIARPEKPADKLESPESDAGLELQPDEQHFVEKETALAEISDAEHVKENGLTPSEAYEQANVEAFYRRIGEEDKDSNIALAETLEAINDEEPRQEVLVHDAEIRDLSDEDEILLAGSAEKEEDEATTPLTATGGGGKQGGGAGRQPPVPPSGSTPPFGGGRRPFGAVPVPTPFNTAPNAAPVPVIHEHYDNGNPVGAALVGGIIGYLIGRRRGRIKTEKKLLPVQRKLQKEVVNLQWQLKTKEMQVREAARAKARLGGELPMVVVAKGLEAPKRVAAPEARLIHTTPPAPEHIGKVLITAETKSAPAEHDAKKPEVKTPVDKHVETMNRAELLTMSDKIIIDGSSLRQIYETHLVGERGLRRLVAEHLRGGNLKRALRREIVEREIDFERDPIMRDIAAQGQSTTVKSATTSPKLQALVQKAAANLPADNEEIAYLKARAKYEGQEQAKQRQQQHILDVSLAGTIMLLVVIITVLILRHA